MRSTCVISAAVLALGSLTAQSVVSPAHFTNAEAVSSSTAPFGVTVATYRYLQVHGDLQGTPRTLKGMAVRRNGTTTTLMAAYSVTLSAWCSNALTTPVSPASVFDSNHGTNKVQVVNSKTINFPQTDYAFVPSPFDYDIVFDAPYVFSATGPLCWEVQITARTNVAAATHDYTSGTSTNPLMADSSFGSGCKAAGVATAMTAAGNSSMNWPTGVGTLIITGTNGPPSSGILVIVGVNSTSFNGIPLPFLLPGSAPAPSGPCFLYTNIILVVPSATLANGSSTTNIPVPATLDLNGLRSYEQILAPSAAANPIGISLSNAVNHNWLAPYGTPPVGRVFLSGSVGATGSVNGSQGLVMRFNL